MHCNPIYVSQNLVQAFLSLDSSPYSSKPKTNSGWQSEFNLTQQFISKMRDMSVSQHVILWPNVPSTDVSMKNSYVLLDGKVTWNIPPDQDSWMGSLVVRGKISPPEPDIILLRFSSSCLTGNATNRVYGLAVRVLVRWDSAHASCKNGASADCDVVAVMCGRN